MNYQPMPAEPRGSDPQGRGAPPRSVQRAVVLIFVGIALSALTFVFSLFYIDDIVEASSGAPADAAMGEAARTVLVVVASVVFLVFGGLYVLLVIFIRKGANWARIVWTVLAVIGLLAGVFELLGAQPVGLQPLGDDPILLRLTAPVGALITVCALVMLWTKESNAYFRGATAARPV